MPLAVLQASLFCILHKNKDAGNPSQQPLHHGTHARALLLLLPFGVQVAAAFTANVWDIKVAVGDEVSKDQTLMVLEAMKMESPVVAPVAGKVAALRVVQGAMTHAGQLLVVIEEAK